jgi:hypothetical protein
MFQVFYVKSSDFGHKTPRYFSAGILSLGGHSVKFKYARCTIFVDIVVIARNVDFSVTGYILNKGIFVSLVRALEQLIV